MRNNPSLLVMFLAIAIFGGATVVRAAERTETFDREPNWEGRNHRATQPAPRKVKQDFGYSPETNHAGGGKGEIGGFIAATAEPAYYATKIAPATFETPLSASGTFSCEDRPFHVLLGFFNSGTLNEWRTPNTIALRLNGRGDKFFAYVEYATAKWKAGGDGPLGFASVTNPATGRAEPRGFPAKGAVHRWSLSYDPSGNDGGGIITAVIDDQTAICHLSPGHKLEGATFNRFGLLPVMKSADDGGTLWLDDVKVNDRLFDGSTDPGWEGFQNRREYETTMIRPRFDFGFSPTHFAGGAKAGELGGVLFRGDCRYPSKMAYYADRLEPLSLNRPLKAGGKIVLRRAVSDSGVLIGFFDSRRSSVSNPSQDSGLPRDFFGVSTDAPSREGFYLAPAYRLAGDAHGGAGDQAPLYFIPTASHTIGRFAMSRMRRATG